MRQFDDPDQAISYAAILLFISAAFDGLELLTALIRSPELLSSVAFLLLLVLPFVLKLAGGIGLIKGKRWGWPVAVAAAVLSVAFALIQLASGGIFAILNLLIYVLLLYLLFRPAVRARFGIGAR
jgi:hypothetical protein